MRGRDQGRRDSVISGRARACAASNGGYTGACGKGHAKGLHGSAMKVADRNNVKTKVGGWRFVMTEIGG